MNFKISELTSHRYNDENSTSNKKESSKAEPVRKSRPIYKSINPPKKTIKSTKTNQISQKVTIQDDILPEIKEIKTATIPIEKPIEKKVKFNTIKKTEIPIEDIKLSSEEDPDEDEDDNEPIETNEDKDEEEDDIDRSKIFGIDGNIVAFFAVLGAITRILS